jgi:thioesterase domain-containing protein
MRDITDRSEYAERLRALPAAKRDLLELLMRQRAGAPGRRPDGVAVLRATGSRSADPTVLVHPVGGGIFCYAELSRLLPDDRPVWAVAADDTLAEGATIEQLAAHYLRLVGRRPAILAGWSFGGLIAYEMGRATARPVSGDVRSSRHRHSRPPVVLIDSMSWPAGEPAWDLPRTARVFFSDLFRSAGADLDERYLDEVDWTGTPRRVLVEATEVLRAHGLDALLEPAELYHRFRLYCGAVSAMRRYRPGPHDGPVSLIHARDSVVRPDEWRARVRGPLTVTTVAGDHYSMLRPPLVAQVAAAWPLADAPEGRADGRADDRPGGWADAPEGTRP